MLRIRHKPLSTMGKHQASLRDARLFAAFFQGMNPLATIAPSLRDSKTGTSCQMHLSLFAGRVEDKSKPAD